jgi:hypothetical protein
MKADFSQEYAKSTGVTDSDMSREEYAKFVETVLSMTPPLATGYRLSYHEPLTGLGPSASQIGGGGY